MSLVITNVQAQFTKMGSFGSPFEFAQGVANQLDESYKLRDKKNAPTSYQRARLADLDPKEIRGAYLFDYTLERVGTDIPTRHWYVLHVIPISCFVRHYSKLNDLVTFCTLTFPRTSQLSVRGDGGQRHVQPSVHADGDRVRVRGLQVREDAPVHAQVLQRAGHQEVRAWARVTYQA